MTNWAEHLFNIAKFKVTNLIFSLVTSQKTPSKQWKEELNLDLNMLKLINMNQDYCISKETDKTFVLLKFPLLQNRSTPGMYLFLTWDWKSTNGKFFIKQNFYFLCC